MFSDFNFERLMNGAPFIFKKDFYIIFRCGYNGETIKAKAITIELVNGLKTDLKEEKLVFDIGFELIKENACQI